MVKFVKSVVIAFSVLAIVGCAKTYTKGHAYPKFYETKPASILIVPTINQSTAAEAGNFYDVTIAPPLAFAGYYVFPLEVTNAIFRQEGIESSLEMMEVDPSVFRDEFGADTVLFIQIDEWDKSYYVIGGHVEVSVSYLMKDTRTGDVVWKYSDSLTVDTSGDASGGILGAIISTAILTAVQDYVPVARQVNYQALSAIPLGPYHEESGNDRDWEVVSEDKMKNTGYDG